MKKKKSFPPGDVILMLALADTKGLVDHYLEVKDKKSASALHRKAVAKQEFLNHLSFLASDWFEKQLVTLAKYEGKKIND